MDNRGKNRTNPKTKQKKTTNRRTKNRNKSPRTQRSKVESEGQTIALRPPYSCFRPLIGSLSLLLFLLYLHSLIYLGFIVNKSPDCFQCKNGDNSVSDSECQTYCDLQHVNDFVFVDDLRERNKILSYFCVLLLIRCIAFITAFLGVFLFVVYFMTAYLAIHLGLIISFVLTLIFFAFQGKSIHRYMFGLSTLSNVVLSIVYTVESIVFIMSLILWFKFFRIKCNQRANKDRKPSMKA